MQPDKIFAIPQSYAAHLNHQDPESFIHSSWSENCDLLLGHVRKLIQKADFSCQRLADELDALAVKAGIYEEEDASQLVGAWMGALDSAQHQPFVYAQFEPENSSKLHVPFGYWLCQRTTNPARALILGWGESADVLLASIRLRVHAATKEHQGYEDLVTWIDDLALSKGFEAVTPAMATAIKKGFGFDAFDLREALAIDA